MVHRAAVILCKDRADFGAFGPAAGGVTIGFESRVFATF
jgi:hypothetical protein